MVSAGKIAEERRSRRGGSFALTPFPNPSQPRPQGEVDPLLCLPATFLQAAPTTCTQRLQQARIEKSSY